MNAKFAQKDSHGKSRKGHGEVMENYFAKSVRTSIECDFIYLFIYFLNNKIECDFISSADGGPRRGPDGSDGGGGYRL